MWVEVAPAESVVEVGWAVATMEGATVARAAAMVVETVAG